MRKALWILACLLMMLATQAGADVAKMTAYNPDYGVIDSPKQATLPGRATDDTDSVIYSEDFESGQGDWTSVDVTNAGFQWHIDSFNGYLSTNSWWCGDPGLGGYNNHWLQYLVSPTLDLSAATNPVLTFKMFHAVEAPGGEPPPYDGWDGCNVWMSTDGGSTWNVITPTFPAYNCQSLYSFGVEWGMGPGIAGWGGSSGGWVNSEFNLSAAAGLSQVQLRFAFCSDPAWCTLNDPSLLGFFVDDVSVDDGATNLLSNNADDPPVPAEFSFDVGGASGDYWTLTTNSAHSGTQSMLCDHAGHYNLSDALVSPWLDVPAGLNVHFRFWLWCDLPDFDGDGDNYLEDYYHVEVTTDEVVWTEVFYDYGDVNRPGGAAVGWEQYLPGDPFNGNVQLDLSAYGGQSIKLRWRVITDDNNDGGIGDGLYIDDVELFVEFALPNDVGAANMLVPMPTSAYFTQIPCSVELHNYGANNQGQVPAFWRQNYGAPNPLIPWASIPAGGMVLKEWNWTTPAPGSYFMDSYTMLTNPPDENMDNDTSKAGLVEVTPADVFEFGYDNRQYSYESGYYFLFDPGEGCYIRYTPQDDGITFNISGQTLKARFFDTGSIRVHVYEAGTATTPGPEVANFLATVTQISPNWQTFDISSVAYLQNNLTDFWVYYERVDANSAHITGDDIVHGAGHFFANFGTGMGPSDYDFFARAVFGPAPGSDLTVTLTPTGSTSFGASGGTLNYNIAVANSGTSSQTTDIWVDVTLPNGSTYGPVLGPVQNFTFPAGFAGDRDRTLTVPGTAPVGTYSLNAFLGDYDLGTVVSEDHFNFYKTADDGGAFVGGWFVDTGEPFEQLLATESVPEVYLLTQNFPNPFNPTTNISFALPQASKVTLAVYDVSGKLVTTLVNGYRNAGTHEVTFNASGLASGIYLYRLSAGDFTASGKMVLMK